MTGADRVLRDRTSSTVLPGDGWPTRGRTNVVDLVEDWQAGVFVIVGAAIVSVVSGFLVARFTDAEPAGAVLGFVGDTILAVLAYSHLRYGR